MQEAWPGWQNSVPGRRQWWWRAPTGVSREGDRCGCDNAGRPPTPPVAVSVARPERRYCAAPSLDSTSSHRVGLPAPRRPASVDCSSSSAMSPSIPLPPTGSPSGLGHRQRASALPAAATRVSTASHGSSRNRSPGKFHRAIRTGSPPAVSQTVHTMGHVRVAANVLQSADRRLRLILSDGFIWWLLAGVINSRALPVLPRRVGSGQPRGATRWVCRRRPDDRRR